MTRVSLANHYCFCDLQTSLIWGHLGYREPPLPEGSSTTHLRVRVGHGSSKPRLSPRTNSPYITFSGEFHHQRGPWDVYEQKISRSHRIRKVLTPTYTPDSLFRVDNWCLYLRGKESPTGPDNQGGTVPLRVNTYRDRNSRKVREGPLLFAFQYVQVCTLTSTPGPISRSPSKFTYFTKWTTPNTRGPLDTNLLDPSPHFPRYLSTRHRNERELLLRLNKRVVVLVIFIEVFSTEKRKRD